jgi:hypothetical protein
MWNRHERMLARQRAHSDARELLIRSILRMIRQNVSGLAIRSCAIPVFWSAIGRKTGFHFC